MLISNIHSLNTKLETIIPAIVISIPAILILPNFLTLGLGEVSIKTWVLTFVFICLMIYTVSSIITIKFEQELCNFLKEKNLMPADMQTNEKMKKLLNSEIDRQIEILFSYYPGNSHNYSSKDSNQFSIIIEWFVGSVRSNIDRKFLKHDSYQFRNLACYWLVKKLCIHYIYIIYIFFEILVQLILSKCNWVIFLNGFDEYDRFILVIVCVISVFFIWVVSEKRLIMEIEILHFKLLRNCNLLELHK